MPKKTIYLIRHGETAYNKKGVVQGRGIDAPLNETGQMQARAFFAKYKDIPFEKIYISMLRRTFQTVDGFIQKGIPFERLEGLDEISWGKMEGSLITQDGQDIFEKLLESWRSGDSSAALDGGESVIQVAERQKVALEAILSSEKESLILIAMHGRAMRILLCQLLDVPFSKMDNFQHNNTCLYILEYDSDTQNFDLKLSNDISHLENFDA